MSQSFSRISRNSTLISLSFSRFSRNSTLISLSFSRFSRNSTLISLSFSRFSRNSTLISLSFSRFSRNSTLISLSFSRFSRNSTLISLSFSRFSRNSTLISLSFSRFSRNSTLISLSFSRFSRNSTLIITKTCTYGYITPWNQCTMKCHAKCTGEKKMHIQQDRTITFFSRNLFFQPTRGGYRISEKGVHINIWGRGLLCWFSHFYEISHVNEIIRSQWDQIISFSYNI